MCKVFHQFSRSFLQHLRTRSGLISFVNQPVDTTSAEVFIQLLALDYRAEETTFAGPIAFLNNAPVHVNNIQTAIRASTHIHGPEIHISRSKKFLLMIRALEKNLAVAVNYFCSTD